MKRKSFVSVLSILYILIFVLCSSTIFWQGAVPALISRLTKTVTFENGTHKTSARELSIVLHAGETELLNKFKSLERADFTGSDNLDEILRWAEKNPQITVSYDVETPDGVRVSNTVVSLDFTSIDGSNFSSYIETLSYLPHVAEIELGSAKEKENPLRADQILQLKRDFPHIRLHYSLEILGQAVSTYANHLDLSQIGDDHIPQLLEVLPLMTELKTIDLGASEGRNLSWQNIRAISDICPLTVLNYRFDLYGKSFTLADETMDLSYCQIEDGGETVRNILACMKQCKTVDMDSCGLSNDTMAQLRAEFPQMDIIWRIWFGSLYSVRTDVERILASKPSVGGMLPNEEVAKLAFCTKLKYLDLGHNEIITDLSFVSSMPELEVFIIAMNPVSDLSPLANCPKLEYLELNTTFVMDLTPLGSAKALRHLNIGDCTNLTDISPLFGLTELERLWIGRNTPIPAAQIQQMKAAAPSCKIDTTAENPHSNGWRELSYDVNTHLYQYSPRYELLRKQLGYDYQEYSFYWLDMKCKQPAPPEYAGTYYIHEDQLNGLV